MFELYLHEDHAGMSRVITGSFDRIEDYVRSNFDGDNVDNIVADLSRVGARFAELPHGHLIAIPLER